MVIFIPRNSPSMQYFPLNPMSLSRFRPPSPLPICPQTGMPYSDSDNMLRMWTWSCVNLSDVTPVSQPVTKGNGNIIKTSLPDRACLHPLCRFTLSYCHCFRFSVFGHLNTQIPHKRVNQFVCCDVVMMINKRHIMAILTLLPPGGLPLSCYADKTPQVANYHNIHDDRC